MKVIHNISAQIDTPEECVIADTLKSLQLSNETPAYVYRKSIDARHKNKIRIIYSIAVQSDNEDARLQPIPEYTFNPKHINTTLQPVVVGLGPAGLFCAYLLAKYGLRPIVLERGDPISVRKKAVETFWHKGTLDPESNVQFGEGGAGAFSDGKLVTRINDSRCRYVLQTLVKFGADEQILKLAKPHIGTDRLCEIVARMRDKIIEFGGQIYYRAKLTEINCKNGSLSQITVNGKSFPCSTLVLATGNGARDTYNMLLHCPATIIAKPFSVGFRMEHKQESINHALYGAAANKLPPAEYNFSTHIGNDTAYTFCMCPGGQVINASSQEGELVTNGMSLHARDGTNANAAMLAAVSFPTPQEGLLFQQKLEKRAYAVQNGAAPVTLAKNFIEGTEAKKFGQIKPTFLPNTAFCDFSDLFPPKILSVLQTGLSVFGKRIFWSDDAVLTGVETRTSAPMRICRDESGQSVGIRGLYPCGEGAGYAGGITSSAVDGLQIAEKIITRI